MRQATIFHNGLFYQGREQWVRAVLVHGNGIIGEVGNDVREFGVPLDLAETIDMKGKKVLPAFEDAHNHPARFGRALFEVDFREKTFSWSEAKSIIRQKAQETPVGDWIVCHGWNDKQWQYVSQRELDTISGEHGILLIHISEHGALLNKKGEELLSQKGLRVGAMVEDELFEDVCRYTAPSRQMYIKIIQKFHEKLALLGVAAVHDMDVSLPQELQAYEELERGGNLLLPSALYVNAKLLKSPELVSKFMKARNGRLQIWGIKLFLDGAIGTRTAAQSKPYVGGGNGIFRMNEEEVTHAVEKAARLELQHIAMHCIGDKAIDFAIAMKQRLQKEYPHMVWRFEHFEMPSKQAIQILATEGGIAVMQPNFSWDAEHYQDRLGERISLINPFRNIQDAGAQFAFGSDDMPSGPLEGIAWACEKAPFERQRLHRDEAIEAYTAAPAHILQAKRGKIEKGYEANFAVCSSDLTKVHETWIRGKKVVIKNIL